MAEDTQLDPATQFEQELKVALKGQDKVDVAKAMKIASDRVPGGQSAYDERQAQRASLIRTRQQSGLK